MAQDPYRYFRIEARELIEQLGQGLLELERQASPELLARLLRQAHTLKGAARVVKQKEMADRAHDFEDALAPLRQAEGPPSAELISQLLQLVDQCATLLKALDAPAPRAAAPSEEARPAARAELTEVDTLLEDLSEAYAQLGQLRAGLGGVRPIQELAELLSEQRDPLKIRSLTEEVRTLLGQLDRRLSSSVDQLERELQQVRDGAEKLRLVPVESLIGALQRMARDSALQLGKSVALSGQGGSVRLDASVLATVQGALLQVVRNAVAHGIEKPDQRLAAGKPEEGRIEVVVTREAGRVTFEVTDDGRGLDLEAVRAAAQRQGIAPGKLEAQELVTLLLRGGLTTSTSVNLVAGRGVGLDVVREATERLGGEVSIRSTPGRSTTVRMRVPITLASLRALQVQAGEESVLLPLECVRHALHLREAQVAHTAERETLVFEGQVLPFLPLSRALGLPSAESAGTGIVVRASGGLLALGVSRLAGITSAMVRPLPELAPASRVVGGAALDASGDPQLVLDPDGLWELAEASPAPEADQPAVRGKILVIDDSLTTRQLEQSILESAGFEVDIAASAEEGLELARAGPFDLILVDVEMPGMDGFTFIEHVRRDPELSSTPCILVTSRNSPEDMRRGVEVGARGHIVKSEFNQKELLERIGNLLT